MIVDQLFNPKPLKEGGPYDLPGIDYDRPGDTPRQPRPQGSTTPRRHPDDPDFMDPDQRRLRADQARVKKAQDEYHAKKGVAEKAGDLRPKLGSARDKGTASRSMPWVGTNPATGKPWTAGEIRDRGITRRNADLAAQTRQVAGDMAADPNAVAAMKTDALRDLAAQELPGNTIGATPTTPTTPTAPAATTAASTFPGEDPNGPGYVGRREVARRQAARAAQASTTPAKPNFAPQGGGYKSVNYATNIKTGVGLPKPTAPAAPTGTKVTAGGPTADEKAKLDQRIAQALKQPVAEMLQMVETKEDVQKIKQFVDQTFVKYGAVNESAFALRNQILEHVIQTGAQRRREHSQRVAH